MIRLYELQWDEPLLTSLVAQLADGESRLLSGSVETTSLSDAPLTELQLPTNVVDG